MFFFKDNGEIIGISELDIPFIFDYKILLVNYMNLFNPLVIEVQSFFVFIITFIQHFFVTFQVIFKLNKNCFSSKFKFFNFQSLIRCFIRFLTLFLFGFAFGLFARLSLGKRIHFLCPVSSSLLVGMLTVTARL